MNLIPFEYRGHSVRVVEIENEPWWVAKDVCDSLGLGNVTEGTRGLDEDELKRLKTNIINPEVGGRGTLVVSEAGLYSLILRSRKPEAKGFKRWITHEVLPQIRKTGAYLPEIPKTLPQALRAYADLVEEKERNRHKVEFFDTVTDSKDAIEIGKAAKVLDVGIGRNKLFQFLRDQGVLRGDNEPYQEYIDRGWFRVVEQKFQTADGETRIYLKTLVYQRGLDGIRRLLKKELITT